MSVTGKVLVLLSLLFLSLGIFRFREAGTILKYDASGYHLYLPAVFIYQDLGSFSFYDSLDRQYRISDGTAFYGLYLQPNGRRVNKYPPGLALGELPCFLGVHLFTLWNKQYPADGYSPPYQFGVALSTLLFTLLGLFFLGKFLRRHFSDTTSAITLFLIALGTNLLAYSILDRGMSHPLVFLQTSAILLLCDLWYERRSRRHIVLLGICLGWAVITRPTSGILLLIPLLWPAPDKIALLKKHLTDLYAGICACTLMIALLLVYWKYSSGHWIHFAYEEEGFDFGSPFIMKGLFSFRKGWFIYTPMALVALIGFIPALRKNRTLSLLLLSLTALSVYVVFSWHSWDYGWSFGCRPLIDILPLLSFPLAALVASLQRGKRWLQACAVLLFAGLIFLNGFQSLQYAYGTLPGKGITRSYFLRVWGKRFATDEDRRYLDPW